MRKTLFSLIIRWRSIKITGQHFLPEHGPYILAPNHVSYIDPPVIGMVVRHVKNEKLYFITRQDIADRFFRLKLADWLGMIPLSNAQPSKSLDLAEKILLRRGVVGIFPEGKRNDEQTLNRPKTGAARLALRVGCPVIPVGVIMPRGWTVAESLKNFFFRSQPIEVHFGKPIPVERVPIERIDRPMINRVLHEIMVNIAALSGKCYDPRR